MQEFTGNIVDVVKRRIFPGKIGVMDGIIKYVEEDDGSYDTYLSPGFIDGHIHIESSMLCPSRFAEAVIPHGTTAVVADPHEIANVSGLEGIDYMIKDGDRVPLNVFFTAPSCVPATPFETAGAVLGVKEVSELLARPEVVALGEMMNFPGVIQGIPDVMAKLDAAKAAGKPIDGHAPMLSGTDLEKYISAGISTDHECISLEEAREKAALGMKIMLREGSASKNLEALTQIAIEYDNCFLVSDDKHPEDLKQGHLNSMLRKAVALGIDPVNAIAMVTINPGKHYNLDRGVLEPGMPADIVEFDNLQDFKIQRVFISGELVSKSGKNNFEAVPYETEGTIKIPKRSEDDFRIALQQDTKQDGLKEIKDINVRMIEIIPDNIVTKERIDSVKVDNGTLLTDPDRDILKLAVVNRYRHSEAARCFISGFGLIRGAAAGSVAHDSHNIIAVGADDSSISRTVNTVITNQGGFAVFDPSENVVYALKLPIAGLMCSEMAFTVAEKLNKISSVMANMGCKPESPFLTLSFMALLVIPELKLSDKGLFDGRSFQFTDTIIRER